MLTRRVIVCLDVQDGRVVKGVQFESLRDVGDPVELARRYEEEGADEITFLDISASSEGRKHLLDLASRTARELFIPLTLGGGISTVRDVADALRAGADKVSVNTAAVRDPYVVKLSAREFGSQCVVVSIDAKRKGDGWRVWTHGGRMPTTLDAVEWASECVDRGAGEILLTSIDRDGARTGYELELTRAVASAVPVPVIASGGAGTAAHCSEVILEAGADGALVAGILHDGVTTVRAIKDGMSQAGIPTRTAP